MPLSLSPPRTQLYLRNDIVSTPEMKAFSHMHRRVWDKGFKTNCNRRTLRASNIEKFIIDVKKEVHSLAAMLNSGTCEACQ